MIQKSSESHWQSHLLHVLSSTEYRCFIDGWWKKTELIIKIEYLQNCIFDVISKIFAVKFFKVNINARFADKRLWKMIQYVYKIKYHQNSIVDVISKNYFQDFKSLLSLLLFIFFTSRLHPSKARLFSFFNRPFLSKVCYFQIHVWPDIFSH